MKFEIKARYDGPVLFSVEAESLKLAVEAAVRAKANLRGSDLRGAIIAPKVRIARSPLQILGLCYPVIIWDEHMKIGCEFHGLAEWKAFSDEQISSMGPSNALTFWRAHKDGLFAIAESDGRGTQVEFVK